MTPDSPLLRLSVESGGCSGFSYKFDVDDVVPTDKDQCGSPRRPSPLRYPDSGSPLPISCASLTRVSVGARRVFERDGARLVIDDLSLDFVKGSTVTYTYGEMIGETFEVQDNPMSEGSCGCGVSFAPSGG